MQALSTRILGLLSSPWIRIAKPIFAFAFCASAAVCIQLPALAVSPPTFSSGDGLYTSGPAVRISAASGASIFYTLDGSQPTTSSLPFTVSSPDIQINSTTTLRAIAVQSGVSSSVASAVYAVDPYAFPVSIDTTHTNILLWLRSDYGITSSSGNVSSWLDLSGHNANATQSSGSNQPSLLLDENNDYPAIKTASNKYFNLPSGFTSMPFVQINVVTKPTSSSNGVLMDLGNGSVSDNVMVSSASSGATFTINQGSTPASITASSALNLGQYQMIKLLDTSNIGKIFVNGLQKTSGSLTAPAAVSRTQNHLGTDSSTSSNFFDGAFQELIIYSSTAAFNNPDTYLLSRYQLLTTVPLPPIISVATGTLAGPMQVGISTPADCVCRFTVDGTTPSLSSPVYQGPINVYYSQTLKAIAIKNGLTSSIASAVYTLDSTQWPAPDPSDTTPLQVNVQAPN